MPVLALLPHDEVALSDSLISFAAAEAGGGSQM
jgi:hypothetical protein